MFLLDYVISLLFIRLTAKMFTGCCFRLMVMPLYFIHYVGMVLDVREPIFYYLRFEDVIKPYYWYWFMILLNLGNINGFDVIKP